MIANMNLSERQRYVIESLYGIGNIAQKTVLELAQELGISRQAIHSLENSIFRKIRESFAIESYAIYMDDPKQALEYLRLYRQKYARNASSSPYLTKEELLENQMRKTRRKITY